MIPLMKGLRPSEQAIANGQRPGREAYALWEAAQRTGAASPANGPNLAKPLVDPQPQAAVAQRRAPMGYTQFEGGREDSINNMPLGGATSGGDISSWLMGAGDLVSDGGGRMTGTGGGQNYRTNQGQQAFNYNPGSRTLNVTQDPNAMGPPSNLANPPEQVGPPTSLSGNRPEAGQNNSITGSGSTHRDFGTAPQGDKPPEQQHGNAYNQSQSFARNHPWLSAGLNAMVPEAGAARTAINAADRLRYGPDTRNFVRTPLFGRRANPRKGP